MPFIEFSDAEKREDVRNVLEQAKAMDKQQKISAVKYGCSDWGSAKDAEQYYTETYGKS
jgi:hypothetical protein